MRLHFTKRPTWLPYFAALVVLLFSGYQQALAQIPASSYGFTAVSGTYTPITGGTTVAAVQSDDGTSGAINIGFTFNYCGVDYTQIKANANCWISFNTATSSTQWTNSLANLTSESIKPALMPFWDDVAGWVTGANASAASYITTGAQPNRVFTFQYKNWQFPRNSSTTPGTYNLQVKLYETTNVIEYIYDRIPPVTTGTSGVTIGIADGAATPNYLTLPTSGTNPTPSSTTFTTTINDLPAAGQLYRFTPPPPCTTSTSLPTSGTVAASPGSLCLSGNVTLSFTPNVAMPAVTGITYKWQTSPTATGTYTDIPGAITTLPFYTTATPVTASAFFRCVVLCTGTTTVLTSSASNQVVVNNPGNPTGVPGSRCGPGSVALSATAPSANPSATLKWYTAATGGTSVATGANYNTPYITANTNFYVTASSGGMGSPQTLSTITTGGNGCSGGVMFDIDPNVTISIDSFKTLATATATGQTIQIYTRTGTYLGNETNAAAWTLVATLNNINTVANQMISLPLTTPIIVNANVVTGVYISYNAAYTSIAAGTMYSNPDLDIIIGAGLCAQFGSVNAGRAFNGSVHYRTTGCEGARVPVLATVTSSPVVTKTAPAVVCNNSVATVSLTPPAPPYSTYTWTPITNLYTDPAGTVPYVANASATNVYMRTTNVGTQTYYMMAGNPLSTTGCTYADTVKIWVQPKDVTIKGNPDTICIAGSTDLKLDTIAGYYPGSIQWQTSTDGVNYTNIAGATTPTYTTPSLNFGQNTYYRAIISAGAATCQSPVKYVVIANPTLLSAPDSFNCGPGTVTLTPVTGGNGTAVWYASASGGFPIGTGSPFVTPYLGATTSFYVASSGGGPSGNPAVGAGALTSGTQDITPYSAFWGGAKTQYIIRAAELTALGIPVGASIRAIGLDVVAGSTSYPGFAISMKNTTATTVTTTFETGLTEVYAPNNITTSTGINNYLFTNPFTWTGGNLLIQMCWSNGQNTATGSTVKMDNTTYASTHRAQSDLQTPSNMCSMTGASAGFNASTQTQRPKFLITFDKKCETARQEVVAHIYPKPVVDLGPDINQCVDPGAGLVLDAGVQPNTPQFLWDNNTTSQVRAVTESGVYNVRVTNMYTCVGRDTVNVILRNNPQIDLGNDTTVCNGVTLTLNPGGNGIEYFWNTGAVQPAINVSSAGSYNVFVTNAAGCVAADTIVVNMQGELPSIQSIQVTNNGQYTFHFTAVNPQNVIGYEWDFGDQSPPSYEESPIHVYPSAADYTVVLRLSSTCGFRNDTISAHIVGIHQINVSNDELSVYPNPAQHNATIAVNGTLKMERIEVYNVLGQVVYKKAADSSSKHLLSLNEMASGVYTIQIYTDKGTVSRKLEILK